MTYQELFNLAERTFVSDTDKYMELIQPFETFDVMIKTCQSWGILNRPLPCKPKNEHIIGDGRRWIYVMRCLSYLLQQAINEKQGKYTESGKAYKLISITRPIGSILKNTWQIKYDSTLRHISIETNVDYSTEPNNSYLPARLVMTTKQSMNIVKQFIDYFKSISPSDVIEQWSLSYAADTFHVSEK